jgi:cytochrome c oxidase assembly factor 6
MGLLSSLFPSEADKRAIEVRTGAVAPSRAERAKCWEARDAYFACLDANGIVDALKDDKKAARACAPESAGFERDCAAQWVSLTLPFLLSLSLSPFLLLSCLMLTGSGRCAGHILQEVAGAGHPEEGEAERARGARGEQDGRTDGFHREEVTAATTRSKCKTRSMYLYYMYSYL